MLVAEDTHMYLVTLPELDSADPIKSAKVSLCLVAYTYHSV